MADHMAVKLAILTPRMRGRERFWAQCRDSIRNEPGDFAHLVLEPEENFTTTSGQAMNILCQRAADEGFTHYWQISDDDFALPGWYEALWGPVLADPTLEAVSCDLTVVKEDGSPSHVASEARATFTNILHHCPASWVTSLDVWRRGGGYPPDDWEANEWLMYIRAHKAKPVHQLYVPGSWYGYRFHDDTERKRTNWTAVHERVRAELGREWIRANRGHR